MYVCVCTEYILCFICVKFKSYVSNFHVMNIYKAIYSLVYVTV